MCEAQPLTERIGRCVCVWVGVWGEQPGLFATPPKLGNWYANMRMPARVAIPIGKCTSSLLGALPTFDDDRVNICVDIDADDGIVG